MLCTLLQTKHIDWKVNKGFHCPQMGSPSLWQDDRNVSNYSRALSRASDTGFPITAVNFKEQGSCIGATVTCKVAECYAFPGLSQWMQHCSTLIWHHQRISDLLMDFCILPIFVLSFIGSISLRNIQLLVVTVSSSSTSCVCSSLLLFSDLLCDTVCFSVILSAVESL